MSTKKRLDLPPPGAPNFEQRLRETLMTYLGRQGDPLDRGITVRDLLESGIARLTRPIGSGAGTPPLGPGTGPGTGPDDETDMTPPPQPGDFTVTGSLTHLIIEQMQPFYSAGRGHYRTRLYGKQIQDATQPLPTFTDAVELAQFEGIIYAHPVPPGSTWRLWIKWETRNGVLSPTPAGGTNGKEAKSGQDVAALVALMTGPGNPFTVVPSAITLPGGVVVPAGTYMNAAYIHDGFIQNSMIGRLAVDDAKIASLSAAKLTAGSLRVGTYIQSSNFLSGTSGWRINADGTAEMQNATLRGTIYANAGLIGGNVIDQYGIRTPVTYTNATQTGFYIGSEGRILASNPTSNTVFDTFAVGDQAVLRVGAGLELRANGKAYFGGQLNAASGTFRGALSAATGTFSGALQGATGEFAGTLRAGVVDFAATQGVTYQLTTPGWHNLTVPAGRNRMRVTVLGAGGGGGGGSGMNGGSGGGGGGAGGVRKGVWAVSEGQAIAVHVGAGGAAGAGSTDFGSGGSRPGQSGAAGQSTLVTGFISAGGGGGGLGGVGFTTAAGGGGGDGDPAGGTGAPSQWTQEEGYVLSHGGGVGAASLYGAGGSGSYSSVGGNGAMGAGGGGGGQHIPGQDFAKNGGRGGNGMATIEFFDANGVVLRRDYDILLAALQRQGIATT